ncbi:A disintegrin and metalloproteinase with thrombospondin motifs adt-1-like [Cylas formicarius]|uniref:A disintegrin and metalloproteinase with thrombospondin motifs adt-1-like n=1 Tax=Cylas formicarius TaxID=197179 RepID=UPI002958B59E|nr:A disintegrin and metalloproteinase with thrombospondin motifs adt-1-like [Cylas formicarius]
MSLCFLIFGFSYLFRTVTLASVYSDLLHNYMNEAELTYYFQTANKNEVPYYEVVFLPPTTWSSDDNFTSNEVIEYNFSAFNRLIGLKLKRNENILGPSFKTYIHDENGTKMLKSAPYNCHYLHVDSDTVAAISFCPPKAMQGLIFLDNTTLEVHPLSETLKRIRKRHAISESTYDKQNVPYLVKRAYFDSKAGYDDIFPVSGNVLIQNQDIQEDFDDILANPYDYYTITRKRRTTLELALFFDEAAYKIFAPHFNYDDSALQNMLLAYINGVQALYHHPSLGTSLELVLVRLDVMKIQPRAMPHYGGERGKLLDSFCLYQASIKPEGDSNPEHWDMGLYVSGLDFYAYENGRKSGVTMGLATVGGVCLDKYACVIAEFGTTNAFGKPYPSAGFTSVYILAHEIGHNLGMHHDSTGNSCPKEGYIMSPSRGVNGETQWSTCSAQVMSNLGWAKCLLDSGKSTYSKDHSRFLDIPGQVFTAKKQCEVLLRDKDAKVSPSQALSSICYSLQCKTPNRSGYYLAGPALDGTQCGNGKYCYGGQCVAKQLPQPAEVVLGGWSQWKRGSCTSGCIDKGRGAYISRRECNNPKPINTDQGCDGPNIQFGFCTDNSICNNKRRSPVDYASAKCKQFSKLLPELDPKGIGLQSPHEQARVWTGCAIYCKRADSGAFYTPRIELNDLGVSPYFPDGTWCHKDSSNLNYYCVQHHCIAENIKFTKNHPIDLNDIPFAQNALPRFKLPQQVKNYFSLDKNGNPLETSIKKPFDIIKEEDWETKDYVELPDIKKRFEILQQEMNSLYFI